MVTIKVQQNGPYVVEADAAKLLDWNGNEYQPVNRASFAQCRCGGSTNKPFCDGTHSRVSFRAAEAAVPGSADKKAR